jgi:hypothetical protein
MLKKSASSVLASFRASTGTRPPHHLAARTDVVLLIRRTVHPRGYASGSSLAAALLYSIFEHPGRDILLYVSRTDHRSSRVSARFSTAC